VVGMDVTVGTVVTVTVLVPVLVDGGGTAVVVMIVVTVVVAVVRPWLGGAGSGVQRFGASSRRFRVTVVGPRWVSECSWVSCPPGSVDAH
jgi:hypothetical protein